MVLLYLPYLNGLEKISVVLQRIFCNILSTLITRHLDKNTGAVFVRIPHKTLQHLAASQTLIVVGKKIQRCRSAAHSERTTDMKKLTVPVILLALVILLSACGTQTAQIGGNNVYGDKQTTEPPTEAAQNVTLNAQVVENNGGSILVCGSTANELVNVSLKNAALIGMDGKIITADALKAGMSIAVDYDGMVLETYPSQIISATKITVTAVKDDVISLYKEAIEHIFNEDKGLNGRIIAVDLARAISLGEGEKSALVYLLSNKFSEQEIEVIAFDRETLEKEGLIEKVEYEGATTTVFKDGVLITVSDSGISGGKLTFNITKWHSGTGAVGFDGCTAECKDGKWTIVYGDMYIS